MERFELALSMKHSPLATLKYVRAFKNKTHRRGLETTPSLGQAWGTPGVLWKWTPACKTKQEALKKDLMSCNADLKSKIKTAARSAELGEPVRNGRALLGSQNTCASVMKEEQDLLAECKAELGIHYYYNELYAAYKQLYGCARHPTCRVRTEQRYGPPSKYGKYTTNQTRYQ